ncbi:MAG: dolichyl-phosphate-mannose-protein mannosyltransferase, partial [Actinomycetota bacterium]|nr:dolichyl-phosphate-mannose-protein mannosyltransferase [Actinomycetota bacterium]
MVTATSIDLPPTQAAVSPRTLRDRLVPPIPGSRLWGWLGPLAITLVAGYLHFNRLSIPSTKVFDEVYYTHDSFSLLHHGVELNKDDNG